MNVKVLYDYQTQSERSSTIYRDITKHCFILNITH